MFRLSLAILALIICLCAVATVATAAAGQYRRTGAFAVVLTLCLALGWFPLRPAIEPAYPTSYYAPSELYAAASVVRGAALYADKGSCYDCHGPDGSGNIDYGAPHLTGGDWLYGGDRGSLYDSVYNGRHGLCPAWIGRVTPLEIRALAVYLHESARQRVAAR